MNERGRRAIATGRNNGDRMFRAAVRHSRRVRVMRLALPLALALLAVVAVVVTTLLDPLRALSKLPIDIGNLVVSGTKITMQSPRLAGFTRDQRPYEVTARAAAQDLTSPDTVELQEIFAKMEMPDQVGVELSARNGVYDTKTEILTLRQDIVVTSSSGYQGRLSEAVVDIRNGNVVSEKPVEIKLLKGTLDANRLEVADAGNVILFDRGVTMTLRLSDVIGGDAKAGAR
jgi:lipopolysaccharide export system protein LptC